VVSRLGLWLATALLLCCGGKTADQVATVQTGPQGPGGGAGMGGSSGVAGAAGGAASGSAGSPSGGAGTNGTGGSAGSGSSSAGQGGAGGAASGAAGSAGESGMAGGAGGLVGNEDLKKCSLADKADSRNCGWPCLTDGCPTGTVCCYYFCARGCMWKESGMCGYPTPESGCVPAKDCRPDGIIMPPLDICKE
jgi:hypothetical protein